jgi:hypothetical protein
MPNTKDFVTEIRPASICKLKGLQGMMKVIGVGTAEWTVSNLFGVVQKI